MSKLGIVAEYNPFHNGHYYHLQKSLEKTGAHSTVVVMSSTFMQRGEPAICDKWSRAEMAVSCGVDLVLELPLPYACASADYFARGAIKLLTEAECTHIAFGAEHPSLPELEEVARFIELEPPDFSRELRKNLERGHSFPRARSLALQRLLEINPEVIESPNNILAVEYLRSIFREKSALKPVAIPRRGAQYHEKNMGKEGFSSATAIRTYISSGQPLENLIRHMPETALEILGREINSGKGPVFPEKLGTALLARLRGTKGDNLSDYPEIAPGLDKRLIKTACQATGWSDLLEKLQTRRFVQTRLQRIFIYILLDLTLSFREEIHFPASPMYFRPLAFNQKGQKILNGLKEKEDVPLLTRPTIRRLPKIPAISSMINLEARATDLWTLFVPSNSHQKGGRDFRTPPVSLI